MNNNTRFIEQLSQDGYFVWPSLLPTDLIDQYLDAYASLDATLGVNPGDRFNSYSKEKQAVIRQARSDFHVDHIEAQKMIFNRDLMAFLQDYLSDEPVIRGAKTGFYCPRTIAHLDSLEIKVSPHGSEIKIWCALEDIHPDSGPMYIVAGSHKAISEGLEREVLTERPEFIDLLRSQMKATTAEEYFSVTKPMWDYVKKTKLPHAIQESGLEQQPLLLKKGDVIIFRPDVVHGTCRCKNPTLTRKVFLASWSAVSAVWYQARAYWGPYHDYRQPENSITFPVYRTPFGLGVTPEKFMATYFESFGKAVVRDHGDSYNSSEPD